MPVPSDASPTRAAGNTYPARAGNRPDFRHFVDSFGRFKKKISRFALALDPDSRMRARHSIIRGQVEMDHRSLSGATYEYLINIEISDMLFILI